MLEGEQAIQTGGIPECVIQQAEDDKMSDWLLKSKKMAIEKDIEAYYLSLTENEKKEDREWSKVAAERAKKVLKYSFSFKKGK